MLFLYVSDMVISYACVVVFISYLIILKLILILVVHNYPKLYLGRALDYGPFAYSLWKTFFFP